MSKFMSIREKIRAAVGDANNRHEVEAALLQIHREGQQDSFTDAYIKLEKAGFSPYDCLMGYMKGER